MKMLGGGEAFRLTELHTFMIAMLTFVIGAAITLSSIKEELPLPEITEYSSRYGYTLSLTLVYLPMFVLMLWFFRHPQSKQENWKAFGITIGLLVPIWSLLDVLAAPSLFQFPNCFATLQIYIPGWVPGIGFEPVVPIEEILFYLGSCILTLMIYMWGCMYFFKNQQPKLTQEYARSRMPLIKVDYKVLSFGLFLLVLAYIWRFYFSAEMGAAPRFPAPLLACEMPLAQMDGFGFPLYFTILVFIVFVPAVVVWSSTWKSVNPAALIFTIMSAVLFSVLWEATLALTYGWWNYNPRWMIGMYIPAWHDLPVEAVLLWLFAGWGVVLIFEFFKLVTATKYSFSQAAFKTEHEVEMEMENDKVE